MKAPATPLESPGPHAQHILSCFFLAQCSRANQMAAPRSVTQSIPRLLHPYVWRRLATAATNEAAAPAQPTSPSPDSAGRRVYLLNRTTPETTDLGTAIRALRAYSFAETETVELSIKCNMLGKKASSQTLPFGPSVNFALAGHMMILNVSTKISC